MKKFLASVFGAVLLSSAVSIAQRSSVDSPHNYKRPVSQKVKVSVPDESQARIVPLKLQSNINSVHNYKRQGSVSFAQESVLAVDVPPLNTQLLNPLTMQNHYKGHFEPIKVEQRAAKINTKTSLPKDSLVSN